MKKLAISFLVLMMCLMMAACGSDKGENPSDANAEDQSVKIEKTVDAVAEELNLGEGTETLYQMIGAEAGKEYKDGSVELYLFDENSDEYKAIEDGNGAIAASATNDGMIILTDDTALVDQFKQLKFK